MLKLEIDGFDQLQKELNEVHRAFKTLSGEIGKIEFDPKDKRSVQSAIRKMERMVDRKASHYKRNPLVSDLVAGTYIHQ